MRFSIVVNALLPFVVSGLSFNAYDLGLYGISPTQHFNSFDLLTPFVKIFQWDDRCAQDGQVVLLSPRGYVVPNPGPVLMDARGNLIWATGEFGDVTNLQVQRYKGEDYLTFWAGQSRGPHSNGTYYMLNSAYEVAHTVEAYGEDLNGDLHEFSITKNGTAMLTVYNDIELDCTSIGIDGKCWIDDCLFQEVDIETGDLVFQWRASEHFGLDEGFRGRGKDGLTKETAFDFFHINSIDKDPWGNYIISSRYMHAITCISPTGETLWKLGGKHNNFTDLSGGMATNFAWQHHARWHENNTLSLFDNAGSIVFHNPSEFSRGMSLSLDLEHMTVELLNTYVHPDKILAISQGSMQVNPENGNVFVGWGNSPTFTEFTGDGEVLCNVHFGASLFFEIIDLGWVKSYRAFKGHWTGKPKSPPAIKMTPKKAFVSWNGATEVATWRLQSAKTENPLDEDFTLVEELPKAGFETEFEVRDVQGSFFRVAALDAAGTVLRYSKVVENTPKRSVSLSKLIAIVVGIAAIGLLCRMYWTFLSKHAEKICCFGRRRKTQQQHLIGFLIVTYRELHASSSEKMTVGKKMAVNMDNLPSEIVLQITLFLEPQDIVNLQLVSKRYQAIGRDDKLWREQCFVKSSFLESLRRRQELISSTATVQEPRFRDLARALAHGNGLGRSRLAPPPQNEARDVKARANERIRIMANWDPSYPGEKVRWYDEYIARNAPISTSFFEQPRNRESAEHEYLEVRGMALYKPVGEVRSVFVVAPLDDGSVCLWDVCGTKGKKGSIVARSKAGILALDDQPSDRSKRSKMISTGVTECITVDNALKRAFVAVQSGLIEVDLETLSTVSRERYPFSITALSAATHPLPITVGTNLALYLYDSRASTSHQSTSVPERVDIADTSFAYPSLRSVLSADMPPIYATLYQPGPLSILHLPSTEDQWDANGDIYVAGRFSSILNYDRRYFPKLRGTIYSGARLCSLASLPYPFGGMTKDLARRGELTTDQVLEAKTLPGKTLIACGEYNSKGSLEMYGLSTQPHMPTVSSESTAGHLQNSTMKNRQTSSSSKLLSVANHGTRIVVSDGGGNLKWLERDGFTEARRWNIAHGSVEAPRGIFGTLGDSYMDSGSGDIALKILNTNTGHSNQPVNEDDLVLWTGEKLGLLDFSSKTGFSAESFEEKAQTMEEAHREREERVYGQTMRRALERQANEVRYVRGLGLGLGFGMGETT
ncbi:F-box domain-containing protein [Phlyctema vagabunda]|uniref:F-box domain-containing protein n=1 Tax=Phlyctema vagabunda TaxID=108571 RepID=A0ABR4PJI4_9HELO